jgi:hypothetical protein
MYWHHSGTAFTKKRSAYSKTTVFHSMEHFKDRHVSRIYLVMCCLYLLYFLEDKTVLISLKNTEICLLYKFPLKYECLKSTKCGTCTLFQQGKSNKIILSCTSKFTNKFLSNKIFWSLSYPVCLCVHWMRLVHMCKHHIFFGECLHAVFPWMFYK